MADYLGGTPGTRRSGGESPFNLTKVGGEDVTLGQKIGDESIPVVIASDQGLTVTAEGAFLPADNKDEDTQHVTGDAGSFILGIRNDSATNTFVSANGDYIGFSVDANGRQFIHDDQLLSAFNSEDFASETTLAAFKAEAKSESDATQVILTDLLTELGAKLESGESVEVTQGTSPWVTSASAPTLEEVLKVKINLTHKWKSIKTIAGTTQTQYVAVAPIGTAVSAASWIVVRILTELATSESQIEGRANIAWDNRADPTIDGATAWEAI